MTAPKPLSPKALQTRADPKSLGFETTEGLPAMERVIGQDRAVEAIRFAIGMEHAGYNLFAHGPQGTGKYGLIRRFLEKTARSQKKADDWVYVNNFDMPHKPTALRLPPGTAHDLRKGMDHLIDDLRVAIPSAFESEEFRGRRQVIEQQFSERHDEAFGGLSEKAAKKNVALVRTPMGLALAPTKNGEILATEDFEKLSKKEQTARKKAIAALQGQLEAILQQMPGWEKEKREKIRELEQDVTAYAVDHAMEPLRETWKKHGDVLKYLDAASDDIIENAEDFLPPPDMAALIPPGHADDPEAIAKAQAMYQARSEGGSVRRYRVNVLVSSDLCDDDGEDCDQPDSSGREAGSPVVDEDHPIMANLVGRIEHLSQFGTLVTDFNLIKPGALHLANGGYLLIDAHKILMQPFAWDALKRALASQRIRIETPGESYGYGTVTLEPEPIPLNCKVVLLGEPELYYLLNYHDPDFRELFKVAADFDDRMERTTDSTKQFAHLIGSLAAKEGLRPLQAGAVARVIDDSARRADDSTKLSVHMSSVMDLLREAEFWATKRRRKVITAKDVDKALEAKQYRSDRISQRIQDEIVAGTFLIETDGARVGQINGLAVMQMDHFTFGKPSRISCQVRIGKGDVVDIEREVALGGPLHTKGVMILSAFLGSRYALDRPLSLSATIVFEQSYGGIDGDSASSTELYAILSALSEIPIKQGFAVTGSVDSFGRVQAIGGVNEKIEGYFDICKARGLTGEQGVLIPATNVRHLMLKDEVVEACRKGRFHVYPIATIDEGIEVLTGVPAGERRDDGEYPIGSVNRAVAKRIETFSRRALEMMRSAERAGPGRD